MLDCASNGGNGPRPLAYGYLRVDLVGRELFSCERRLRAFASEQGYELATVFQEWAPAHATLPEAFIDLIQECRRAEAHVVITVCGHLTGMSMPRQSLLDLLAARGNAQVCEVPA